MSWEQLKATIDEQRRAQADEERKPPEACPYDGEPLDVRSDGVRSCRFGNYVWPRDGKR